MKYLPLYYKWTNNGRMPLDGLCNSLNHDREFSDIFCQHSLDGFWGYAGRSTSNLSDTNPLACSEFTPLRQNIVLLLAAMNNEL
jgi:hypothetical protein